MLSRSLVVLPSLARTVSGDSGVLINDDATHLQVYIDVTAVSGTTPTLAVSIQARDPASGKFVTLLASTSLTASGTTVLRVGPGLPVTANASANDVLPLEYKITYTIGGTTPSFTFSVGASYSK